jgi:hypothetical protein
MVQRRYTGIPHVAFAPTTLLCFSNENCGDQTFMNVSGTAIYIVFDGSWW